MPEQRLIGWGAVLVVVATAAILLFFWNVPKSPVPVPGGAPPETPLGSRATSAPATFSPTVPRGAALTEAVSEAPAAPGAAERFKIVDLAVTERGYNPATLTVRMGDITQVRFSALDGEYDLFVPYAGLYQSVRRGETKYITFQATTVGTFKFFCRDHCPSGGRIEGLLVVLPKQ